MTHSARDPLESTLGLFDGPKVGSGHFRVEEKARFDSGRS